MADVIDLTIKIKNLGDRALKGLKKSTNELKKGFESVRKSVVSVQGALVGLGAGLVIKRATSDMIDFQRAMAEVATLTKGTAEENRRLTLEVLRLSKAFGQAPAAQARALYDTISGGFRDASEAVALLTTANKLAIAGVTDINSAFGTLLATLKPYELGVREAAATSDKLFAVVESGIVTIDALSGTLGRVAPAAAQAGISLDDMLGSIAAITATTKLSAPEVATQITSLANAIQKGAATSKKVNKDFDLSVNFSKSAVSGGRLISVLKDTARQLDTLTEAQQATARATLIGSEEAQRAFAVLTGSGAQAAVDSIKSIGDSAGATEAAFAKMAATIGFKLDQLEAELTTTGILATEAFQDELFAGFEKFRQMLPGITSGLLVMGGVIRDIVNTFGFVGSGILAIAVTFDSMITLIKGGSELIGESFANVFGRIKRAGEAAFKTLAAVIVANIDKPLAIIKMGFFDLVNELVVIWNKFGDRIGLGIDPSNIAASAKEASDTVNEILAGGQSDLLKSLDESSRAATKELQDFIAISENELGRYRTITDKALRNVGAAYTNMGGDIARAFTEFGSNTAVAIIKADELIVKFAELAANGEEVAKAMAEAGAATADALESPEQALIRINAELAKIDAAKLAALKFKPGPGLFVGPRRESDADRKARLARETADARAKVLSGDDFFAGAGVGIAEFAEGFSVAREGADALNTALGNVKTSLADTFQAMITGSMSAKEAFSNLAKSMLSEIAAIIAKLLAALAIKAALTGVGAVIGGPVGAAIGGSAATVASGNIPSSPTETGGRRARSGAFAGGPPAQPQGGASIIVVNNTTNNIQATDVDSFNRQLRNSSGELANLQAEASVDSFRVVNQGGG